MRKAALDTYLDLFASTLTKQASLAEAIQAVAAESNPGSIKTSAGWRSAGRRLIEEAAEDAVDPAVIRMLLSKSDDVSGFRSQFGRNADDAAGAAGGLVDDAADAAGGLVDDAAGGGISSAVGDAAEEASGGINPWWAGAGALGLGAGAGLGGFRLGQKDQEGAGKPGRWAAYGGGLATGLAAPHVLKGVNSMVSNQGMLPGGNYGTDWTSI
jgi:hypothetical protein